MQSLLSPCMILVAAKCLSHVKHNIIFSFHVLYHNFSVRWTNGRVGVTLRSGIVLQIAARMKVEKGVMQEQREAEEELAVFMNRRLVKEVCVRSE